MDAGVLDVDIAAEARVEKQIPAGMIVVVVDVDLIFVPIPITAAGNVVSSDHPVGTVKENEAARANVKSAYDIDISDVFVAAVRVRVARANAGAIVVPAGIMRIAGIVPSTVIAVIVPITFVFIAVMFVPALVLAVAVMFFAVMTVVTVALRRGNSQAAGQCQAERR